MTAVSEIETVQDRPLGNTDNSSPPEPRPQQEKSTQGDGPPDGGLVAWLQVIGGFMLFFNTWGMLNTFGVFQTYYESGELFQASSSNISWIGSLQSCCLLLTGLLSGPVLDRGYLRILLVFGTFFVTFSLMMLSVCRTYWEALICQGVILGIGGGCLFVPAVAVLPMYFRSKLATAMGLAASGSSTGGIIYPIVFYRLVPRIGFSWAVRVLGFMALGTLLIPLAVMRLRVKPAKPRAILDWSTFTDLHFMILIGAFVIGYAGLYVGLFYLSYFGEATGITNESLSFYLVPILNAGSVFGRTLPNILADKIGPLNVVAPGTMIVSIVLFSLLAVKSAASLVVCVVFFGFFSGIYVALPAVCFVALTHDKSKIGTRIGMGMAMLGLGVLMGGPGGGGIQQSRDNGMDFTGTWIYAGATTMACSIILFILRFMKAGFEMVRC
ncbi:hypothetical protein ASPZODRAFT_136401 [Penicilliopsis zonata CBS 506.65]|uniref:Major facilitator superfamily (MFS) profile domain-containing protein n=1 Tax=Penicilliopsis zonata CBS 506.65 TaxID=1073090 RepID=A0A1L9S7R3_9EURO|nr:hypothetical protein ASPZODRAFT_136401 [Penicilliopsis zonata CBS 506.65]OJJ43202.1 hypothetical protein ASPZODRAFT_136401 [Penicilliopsis zonata CBS 506.65]